MSCTSGVTRDLKFAVEIHCRSFPESSIRSEGVKSKSGHLMESRKTRWGPLSRPPGLVNDWLWQENRPSHETTLQGSQGRCLRVLNTSLCVLPPRQGEGRRLGLTDFINMLCSRPLKTPPFRFSRLKVYTFFYASLLTWKRALVNFEIASTKTVPLGKLQVSHTTFLTFSS